MIETRRSSLSLDGSWDFVPDPGYRLAPERLPAGAPVPVPGAWEAAWPDPQGIVHAWYRRSLAVPDDWPRGTLVLRFASAMARARVWLDGTLVGEHGDGYLPFEVETGRARPGATHGLVVEVANPMNAVLGFPAFGLEAIRAATGRLGGHDRDPATRLVPAVPGEGPVATALLESLIQLAVLVGAGDPGVAA